MRTLDSASSWRSMRLATGRESKNGVKIVEFANDFENLGVAHMRGGARAGGRPVTSWRPKTTDYLSIDIARLRRQGARSVGYSGRICWSSNGRETGSINYNVEASGLRLRYRTASRGDLPHEVDEVIPLVTTPMHLGGHRHWFACPSCGRRCRILYGGALFRCRLCRGAAYESQYQRDLLTVCDIRWRIRERLEERGSKLAGLLGLDDGFPEKPPRMHWSTYRRLEALDRKLAAGWRVAAKEWLERLDPHRRARPGEARKH